MTNAEAAIRRLVREAELSDEQICALKQRMERLLRSNREQQQDSESEGDDVD